MAWEFGNTGLDKETLKEIHRILYSFPKVKEAVLFGSRAKGCPKKGSDIDIAIIGEIINLDYISTILAIFEASLIPFMIDLVDFRGIKNAGLRSHIERVGITIYRRDLNMANYFFN